ncbi:uncharacterized protein BP01DRAFT_421493 [Aspergillus saccharolyticus JOP 1030-1]|uniref:Uncharacterized protein n=1 Tax=Aspergillus saccharolyticus JOP 1030-1 TaxID=1450539 RepID=A0A318ZUU2_9EURO|nr:hypothetical protein BP01DRAFT_421493 [Aspergillus saccharolyticus JOP 1030-1]PYH47770.1 hypothetical protein BP01DRAFT_421493 [Aspergillus saccharolyticus JOP 1030-1]
MLITAARARIRISTSIPPAQDKGCGRIKMIQIVSSSLEPAAKPYDPQERSMSDQIAKYLDEKWRAEITSENKTTPDLLNWSVRLLPPVCSVALGVRPEVAGIYGVL